MRPTLLIDTLKARMTAHMNGVVMRPAFVRGPPGIGKTQTIEFVAHDMGVGYSHIHGPTMLAEDFGIPMPQDGTLRFAVPEDKFPFEDSAFFPEDAGLVNLDEMGAMGNDQQKIVANLVQQRELHGRKIKPGWMFIATGNRMEDRAGAVRILSHLADRYTYYDYEVNKDDWYEWALTRGGVKPEVVAFLQFRADMLAPTFDPNAEKCATPRGWSEGVSRSLGVVPSGALFESLKGDVGEGPATEFIAFHETFTQLPDPDLVLAKPDTYHVPDEAHILYALIGALVGRVDDRTFQPLLTYAKRMPAEFMVMLVRNCIQAKPQLTQTTAFTQWAGTDGARALFGR